MAPRLSGPMGSRSTRSSRIADSSSERLRPFTEATGEQKEDGRSPIRLSANVKRARRRRVEPLDVVDRNHDRRLGSKNLQRASDCNTQRARIEAVRTVFKRSATSSARRLGGDNAGKIRSRARSRTSRRGRREPVLSPTRPAATRGHAILALGRPRRPQATLSTSRFPPRLPGRVRPGLPPDVRGTRVWRRTRPPCRRCRRPSPANIEPTT